MIKFLPAELCPEIDDFLFSSVISHCRPHSRAGVPVVPRRRWRAPLAALGAALLLAGCQAETAPAPSAARPVRVQRVNFETIDAARDFVGVVRARYETDLGFRVAARLSPASSTSATAFVLAMSSHGSILRTFDCRSRALRPNSRSNVESIAGSG